MIEGGKCVGEMWRGVTPENQTHHDVHAVTSAMSKLMIKEPTLHCWRGGIWFGHFVSSGFIPTHPINNTSHSHSFLSLFLSLSLSLSTCVFSLCRISPISPLPYLFCSSNSHIHTQQCTIFRTNAILIFDFRLCPFYRWIRNAWGNGKLSQWWVLSFAELRRQQRRGVIGAATSHQSGGNRK